MTYIAGGGVETEVYSESGEDFEQGELDGVVAGKMGWSWSYLWARLLVLMGWMIK